ncbi:hypothetical protein R1flu_000139 [Riccia fluitans]|uniref:Autophagy-related protein 2 n=1 Tax=Riccia fluitans TaxID=41844 RepID=A0ABD1XZL7_9MARC
MSKMLSQWVFKRICKFFVRRLLGRLLRSEIDLDQLDVQLGLGTIVLKDLHLNTEYLNDQLGSAAVDIKTGVVGSIKAKIPWRVLTDESCVIELEDLKLVVVPRPSSGDSKKDTSAAPSTEKVRFVDSQDYLAAESDGYAQGVGGGGAYMGVDDGVRVIAQMVERILLNLRIKVANLIIVFEEQDLEPSDGNGVSVIGNGGRAFYSTLLVRVPRMEYGVETAVPEMEDNAKGSTEGEPNMLVKVVKFEGATVEVADVLNVGLGSKDRFENSTAPSSSSKLCSTREPVKILEGDHGGIYGTIQLSVPWKDGTVDVPKFHADLVISYLQLKVSPQEIYQLSSLVRAFTSVGGTGLETASFVPVVGTSAHSAVSFGDMPKRNYVAASAEKSRDIHRSISESVSATSGGVLEATSPNNSFLPLSRFISNWMYSGGSEGQKTEIDVGDADLAASVDEFFECFDGTRSMQQSQASGLWNWPRSAFSAITAASSLAAGSTIVPPDADNLKQVEYSIKAKLAGISVTLFYDVQSPADGTQSRSASVLEGAAGEFLNAELLDITCFATVAPNQMDCTTTVKNLDISEVVLLDSDESTAPVRTPSWQDKGGSHVVDTQTMQAAVEKALPSFPATLGSFLSGGKGLGFSDAVGSLDSSGEGRKGLGTFQSLGKSYEKKRLLGLHSGSEHSMRITVTLDFCSKSNFTLSKVHCFLQPLVIWLDVHTLKRMESAIRKSEDAGGTCGRSAVVEARSQGPRGWEGVRNKRGVVNEDSAPAQGSCCPWNLYSSNVRVIICFPAETGDRCSRIQEDFIELKLSGPPSKNGSLQPMLVYRQLPVEKLNASTGTGPSVLLRFGEVAANLILNDTPVAGRREPDSITVFHVKEVIRIFHSDPVWGALPTLDRTPDEGTSMEVEWDGGRRSGDRWASQTWNGIAAQQVQTDGGPGIGGSNSEFAAATTAAELVEEQNSQLRKELIFSSSLVVRINLPQVQLHLSELYYIRLLELMKCFAQAVVADKKEEHMVETEVAPVIADSLQVCILLQCGQVDIDLFLPAESLVPAFKQSTKPWDIIAFDIEKLQVLSVTGIDGVAETSYLWVHHEEGQVTGSYQEGGATGADVKSEVLLLSCRNKVLGRGDGGGGNALASGTAGMTITYMFWPGQETKLGDALLTATIRGSTFVAHGGRLDWLLAVSAFFNRTENEKISGDAGTDSESGETAEYKSTDDQSLSSAAVHIFFLLDLQDVALCYEPGSEALLVPGLRVEKDPLRRVTGSSLDSSQVYAPVACILAAAAVRVSSSLVPQPKGERFDIWFRDVALHLLDTSLRKHPTTDYTTASIKRTGYMQVAREAVMGALVRINCEDGLQWEVECANSQLRFDTCHDTTAAFGRLIGQLQQLFAPEIDQTSLNGNNNRNIDQKGSSSGSPGSRTVKLGVHDDMDSSVTEIPSELNLFEGVLEDAFSRVKPSRSFDDQISERGYGILNVPIHSRVGSMDRYESVHGLRPDIFGAARSSPSTPRIQNQADVFDELPLLNNASGPPIFIEDYYITLQKQGTSPGDRQSIESPQPSGAPSRGSTSSGGGRDVEGRGGWYAGKSLKVLENHVPQGSPRLDADQESSNTREQNRGSQSPGKGSSVVKKYPLSVGRVVLSDLEAKWRLYGGSDWPVGRDYDEDLIYQSNLEDNGRQSGVCLEVQLLGMRVQYDTFPAVGVYASRLHVTVKDVAVYDDSVDAPWRTVLSYNRSKARPRESSSQAVNFEMDAVRPNPTAPLEEYRLLITLLPISLHLDQRHIDFCIQFFSARPSINAELATPTDAGAHSMFDSSSVAASDLSSESNEINEEALLPFFQICEMRPFTIRVDYVPRRVDISSLGKGNYAELLNLVSWKGIELNLKHVRATGVHGWSSLSGVLVGEWLEDISQNQVHKLVKGMAPIRPFYAVGTGAAKLVVLPVEHYRRDRRLLRGMRKGAVAFLRSISLEVLGFGAHLAEGAHQILKQTELAMGGTLSPLSYNTENGERRSKAVQPGDTREGIQQACESISRGFERTASSLVGNPYKAYQRGGAGPAVATALRSAPSAAVAPASAAAGAVHRLVLGLRNELDPERKRESDEKHSGPPPDNGRALNDELQAPCGIRMWAGHGCSCSQPESYIVDMAIIQSSFLRTGEKKLMTASASKETGDSFVASSGA